MLKSQWSWLSWVLVGIVVVSALIYGSLDDDGLRTDAQRASDLANTVRCPQCTGQSVAESDVPIARTIRAEIAERIDEGDSDAEITQSLVDSYGESILLTPSGSGLVGLIWIVPVVATALAATALGLAFARWKAEVDAGVDAATADAEQSERDAKLVARVRANISDA